MTMPELYFREDIDTHLAPFPDLKAHTMLALRHLARCHADEGAITMMGAVSPEMASISLYCAACGAPEAQIAVQMPGGVRYPPCPHEDMGPWDVWYAAGMVVIGCHVCQQVSVELRVATEAEFDAGTHLRRDTVIPQWFQASKAAAASNGHAVHG
jgi:hypothetical protein